MRRILLGAVLIVVCFLLQCSVFEYLRIASIASNLLVIITATIGFIRGRNEGMLVGFFCGLLLDIMSGTMIGYFAFIYLLAGYLNGFFKNNFYPENIKLPVLSILITDFLINLAIYVSRFLTIGHTSFGYYLLHTIITEMVYTAVCAVVLYLIILKINQKLELIEKRSAAKFG